MSKSSRMVFTNNARKIDLTGTWHGGIAMPQGNWAGQKRVTTSDQKPQKPQKPWSVALPINPARSLETFCVSDSNPMVSTSDLTKIQKNKLNKPTSPGEHVQEYLSNRWLKSSNKSTNSYNHTAEALYNSLTTKVNNIKQPSYTSSNQSKRRYDHPTTGPIQWSPPPKKSRRAFRHRGRVHGALYAHGRLGEPLVPLATDRIQDLWSLRKPTTRIHKKIVATFLITLSSPLVRSEAANQKNQ